MSVIPCRKANGGARRLLLVILVGLLIQPALAEENAYMEHEVAYERLSNGQKIAPIGMDAFGDQISYFSGGLSFANVDISVPGNSGLPVELRRTFQVEDRREFNLGPNPKENFGGFAEWSIDVPHLSALLAKGTGWKVGSLASTARCSTTAAPSASSAGVSAFGSDEYWNGYNLNVPGQGSTQMLSDPSPKLPAPTNGVTYPWVTKSMWRFSCLPSTKNGYGGEAFVAVSPEGTKYYLDYVIVRDGPSLKRVNFNDDTSKLSREMVYFMASRAEDRHGNYVDYTYAGDKLTRIEANDGRYVQLTYSGANVISATSSVGTWTYAYSGNTLSTVTRPDGSQWTYSRTGKLRISSTPELVLSSPNPTCDRYSSEPQGGFFVYEVSHPAGAKATFTLAPSRLRRTNVPKLCVKRSMSYQYWRVPNYTDSYVLRSKVVSGHNIGSATWTFEYENLPGIGGWQETCAPGAQVNVCPPTRYTIIRGPEQRFEKHTYGVMFGVNEGQLLKREIGTSATDILRTETTTYISSAEADAQPFPNLVGWDMKFLTDPLARAIRPVKRTVISQQGVDFVREVTAFDAFANPTQQSVSGTASRTEATEYHHDLSKWVIGLPKRQLIAGVEVSRTDYDAQSLPWKVWSHGLLKKTITYDVSGNIATIADALNRTDTLSSWHRGVPRSVVFPDGTTQLALVTDQGWVTGVTDQNGFPTSYSYDVMGRVAGITPPTGDSVAWAPTAMGFQKTTTAQHGFPAGTWHQWVVNGNARKLTYFDALWRPLLTREYDDTNPAATNRFSAWAYDAEGRQVFAGYPRASASSIASFTQGVWTDYDVLGRPLAQSQDSEQGLLTTLTAYLPGFTSKVTDPRGNETLTSYVAYDQPTAQWPRSIAHPENAYTHITRDVFGKPLRLRRSNSSSPDGGTLAVNRSYTYNARQQLCRVVEPETGATLMGYDAVGNLAWSAAGLDAGQACSDSGSAAAIAARRVDRQYDALNRLVTLTFPDANGNQAWTYTPDGLPATISTLNQGGASSVTNTYSYNKRRLLTAETSGIPGWYSWTIGYAYDTHGHLASQTYPTGLVVSYAPNALGQATQAGSYASGVQYHPNGAIKQFTYGNGLIHTMVQNVRQLPQRSTDTGGALDHQYAYDGNGNVLSTIDHNDGTRSRWMAYDGLNRLTDAGSVVFGGDHWHRFTYDVLDNLKSWKLAGVKDFGSYFYDINNRLAAIDSTGGASLHTFAYDAQGNVVDKDGLGFEFDYGNRLRTAETDGGVDSYRYDGLGRRVMTAMADGGQKLWMYSRDGQMLFSFKGPDNQSTHENVYLGGSLVASIDHAWPSNAIIAVKYQHTDALGSPVAESNQAGVVTNRINYDPYGSLISGTAGSVGYTGHVMDPVTGLTYMQQRYYDPAIGRFLSIDPVSADPLSGANFNRYWYSNNSPFRFVDPDGRQSRDPNFVEITDPTNGQRILVHREYAVDAMFIHPGSPGAESVPEYREVTRAEVADGLDEISAGFGLASLALMATPGAEPVAALTGTVSAGASILAAVVEPTEERWSMVVISGFISGARVLSKGSDDTFEAASESADATQKALSASMEAVESEKEKGD